MVELAETAGAADADDLHRTIPLDTSRPAPLVVHADHAHRAADPGLRVRQRSQRSLDAAVGRVEKLAEMGDLERRPVRCRGRLTRPKVDGNLAGEAVMAIR